MNTDLEYFIDKGYIIHGDLSHWYDESIPHGYSGHKCKVGCITDKAIMSKHGQHWDDLGRAINE